MANLTRILAVVGPTASGKTELAIQLAHRYEAEVISVDSMQVYRGMDIGTAKPTLEDREGIPHHLIDVADPGEDFSVAEFRRAAREVITSCTAPVMIIAGGSGLHFRAVIDPMTFAPTDPLLRAELEEDDPRNLVAELVGADEKAGSLVDLANKRRVIRAVEILRLTGATPTSRSGSREAAAIRDYLPELEFTAVGVDSGDRLPERVAQRTETMVTRGLIAEVMGLRGKLGRTARAAVGYKEILDAADAGSDPVSAVDDITLNTGKLAGRQRTWFHRDPRIRWIPWSDERETRFLSALEVIE